jgi:Zn finger protein HypA/HybF involved in hydrogenase expression
MNSNSADVFLLLEASTACPSCEQPMIHEPGFYYCPRCHYGLSEDCVLLNDSLEAMEA